VQARTAWLAAAVAALALFTTILFNVPQGTIAVLDALSVKVVIALASCVVAAWAGVTVFVYFDLPPAATIVNLFALKVLALIAIPELFFFVVIPLNIDFANEEFRVAVDGAARNYPHALAISLGVIALLLFAAMYGYICDREQRMGFILQPFGRRQDPRG
jgi:hypothetical protein